MGSNPLARLMDEHEEKKKMVGLGKRNMYGISSPYELIKTWLLPARSVYKTSPSCDEDGGLVLDNLDEQFAREG